MSGKTELREQAFALYKPPFKFRDGYIYDSADHMVSDGPDETGIQRVRGWGRIGYMPKGEQLQDAVGELIADALTAAWNRRATIQPTAAEPVGKVVEGDLGYKIEWRGAWPKIGMSLYAAPVAPADAVRDARDLALADDLRALGLTVAVHNDYRLNGETHTFWLFTDATGMSYKGEGRTDAEALNAVRAALKSTPKEPAK